MLDFIEFGLEIALYLGVVRIILLLKGFVSSVDSSRMSVVDQKKIQQNERVFKISIVVISFTMIMSSSYQVLSPWLYISATFTKDSTKLEIYEWLYQLFFFTNLLFNCGLLYFIIIFHESSKEDQEN